MPKEPIAKIISLAAISALMLVLSYLFSLSENSGSVPLILLFAGILLAAFLALTNLTSK